MNSGAPFFTSELEDTLYIVAPGKKSYVLPPIADPDDDPYAVSVSLRAAIPFTTFDKTTKTITFNPKLEDAGQSLRTVYRLKIELCDLNPRLKLCSPVYWLNVEVSAPNTQGAKSRNSNGGI
jgi:hypothetical protein